jgi:aryl-alcohol dehydrogenase-like predicted oxidoreductase
MHLRDFGRTGMRVSALGFGAWAIGGNSYGAADRAESLRALALAEERGCNFVDTAMVYGDSEQVLGEFLPGRRERWLVASKYSGQPQGMRATLETQLRRLRTDRLDFYQIHWMPDRNEGKLFDELLALKAAGLVRAVGVSLKSARDITRLLARGDIDGFMLRMSLLDPDPFLACRDAIATARPAVVVRSALREGFLSGKFNATSVFDDPADQRREWTRERIAQTVAAVEHFRFLENDAGSLAVAAARYPLCFPEVSTVVVGTRSALQAQANFGTAPASMLGPDVQAAIAQLQDSLGLRSLPRPLWRRILERIRS